jgi:hypothetical protein
MIERVKFSSRFAGQDGDNYIRSKAILGWARSSTTAVISRKLMRTKEASVIAR